jgi:REP element-mobilizing transposase RayT
LKQYRIHPEETSYYYTTSTITDWLPVFQEDRYFQIVIESLKFCRQNKGLFLLAYVIMPTHFHMVTANSDETSLSDIMRDFRQYTSRRIRTLLQQDGRVAFLDLFRKAAKMRPNQEFKVWSDDFHPIALKSNEWMKQKIDYIHNNPVRKGFVESPEHWKYSSARNWLLDDNRIIELDKNLA